MAIESCNCWFCTGQSGDTPLFTDNPEAVSDAESASPDAAIPFGVGTLTIAQWAGLKSIVANVDDGRYPIPHGRNWMERPRAITVR